MACMSMHGKVRFSWKYSFGFKNQDENLKISKSNQISQLLISLNFKATILQQKSKTIIIFKTHHKNKTVFHWVPANVFGIIPKH